MTKEKMVLVIDKPVDCLECRFYSEYGMECWYLHNAKYYVDERPPFCPLKPLPGRKSETIDVDGMCYSDEVIEALKKAYRNIGRNEVLDEILGGEE